ncbi:uncharacterized protein LOC131062859 [Cryptomeria japonica]|uniref:uncharacterized protein LOC131062859 n=1 Tax=Cryptomeria japonica TaxID=3369 RepID=UPI0025AD0188|nr:uncharacterized protein LOC131062859 [Cryptomeria japonica]
MEIGKRETLLFWLILGIQLHASLQFKLDSINRDDFPENFIFGASTSAYQVEGAAQLDGRKPCIWDTYTHSGKMFDGSTADVTADQYHHYKEDVRLMFKMGLDAYRFSISWSRLIPDGKGAINPKGLEYYNNLINELIIHGIQPHVTLFHFDLPQSLEDAYGGWLSPRVIEDFRAFAEVCFREFGDRVKYWTTFNEPNAFPPLSYDIGWWPPQRCSSPFGFGNCSAGDSTEEPYLVAHHVLLSHAAAVELYRENFQAKQKGFISLVILALWYVPLTNSSNDIAATQRTIDFHNGWFIDPLFFGDYPSSMKKIVGSRLPNFTKEQSKKLKGSFDFVGLNHYGTYYVSDSPSQWIATERDYIRDLSSKQTVMRDDIPIGKFAPTGITVVPWGFQALLEHFKQHYGNPAIIIYENGYGTINNQSLPLSEALNDTGRMEYLHDYLDSLLLAIRNGSNTRGYFVWTLMDNFEFLFGFKIRYGLFYVDFKDKNLKRYPTLSACWLTKFLKGKKQIEYLRRRGGGPTKVEQIAASSHFLSTNDTIAYDFKACALFSGFIRYITKIGGKMEIGKRETLLLWFIVGIQIHASLQFKLDGLNRDDFPENFIFGASTSAYQVEGAVQIDGRKPCIWDTYTHSGKMFDGSTGDVTADQYHHYKEDVRLMFKMGLDAYRFSISWSRLIPDGRGAINPEGLEYYNNLINELILHGIQPHVTLFHFDLPQSLEDAYGGWLSPQIVEDFRAFAEVCFREFGDRVKYWTTFNEPNAFPPLSYDIGWWPPQRCSYPFGFGNCSAGDSTEEPYIVGHHVLLSHAEAVELYRKKFQAKQKGFISLVILALWYVPLTNSSKDIAATQRTFDFQNGWFIDPLFFGDYPSSMKKIVGSRLPNFTKEQSKKLKGSFDFVGLNHYGTYYVSDLPSQWVSTERDFMRDLSSKMAVMRDDVPIGEIAPTGITIVPSGFQALLEHFKQHYGNPAIIIYENGYGTINNQSLPLSEALNDTGRMEYLHDYLDSLLLAIRNGSNTQGYFVWTLMDNFEFLFGFKIRYGLFYVDFKDKNLKRYPTLSARWFTKFLKGKRQIEYLWTRRGGRTNVDKIAASSHFLSTD